MTNEWHVLGSLARQRRERLGLKQSDLQARGGPGVATVGKFENAAQESFPLRTQHQMENALGWDRGIIEDVLEGLRAGEDVSDWMAFTVRADAPDMSEDPPGRRQRGAASSDDDDLEVRLRSIEYRLTQLEAGQGRSPERSASHGVAEAVAERVAAEDSGVEERGDEASTSGDSARVAGA